MKIKLKVLAVAGLAMATAACGGNDPAPEAVDTTETAASDTAAAAPEAAAEVAVGANEATDAAVTTVAATANAKPASFAQCAVCHVTEAGKAATLGPNLFGVVGRVAGTSEGFNYSPAMKDSGLTWDAKQLDSYITTPQKVVPGTRMAFGGVADAAKRKEIVDYLATLK